MHHTTASAPTLQSLHRPTNNFRNPMNRSSIHTNPRATNRQLRSHHLPISPPINHNDLRRHMLTKRLMRHRQRIQSLHGDPRRIRMDKLRRRSVNTLHRIRHYLPRHFTTINQVLLMNATIPLRKAISDLPRKAMRHQNMFHNMNGSNNTSRTHKVRHLPRHPRLAIRRTTNSRRIHTHPNRSRHRLLMTSRNHIIISLGSKRRTTISIINRLIRTRIHLRSRSTNNNDSNSLSHPTRGTLQINNPKASHILILQRPRRRCNSRANQGHLLSSNKRNIRDLLVRPQRQNSNPQLHRTLNRRSQRSRNDQVSPKLHRRPSCNQI